MQIGGVSVRGTFTGPKPGEKKFRASIDYIFDPWKRVNAILGEIECGENEPERLAWHLLAECGAGRDVTLEDEAESKVASSKLSKGTETEVKAILQWRKQSSASRPSRGAKITVEMSYRNDVSR